MASRLCIANAAVSSCKAFVFPGPSISAAGRGVSVSQCGAVSVSSVGKILRWSAGSWVGVRFKSLQVGSVRSLRKVSVMATEAAIIKVGDKLPEAELAYLDKENNVVSVKVSELTAGKKVVLFAVPGAYTPVCSQKHLPEFSEKADELKAKGVDTIGCISVNDVFVMKAWGESLGVQDKFMLLSDKGDFTKSLGLELDLSDKPAALGVRSRRYAMLADDGVVKVVNSEEGGAYTVSGPLEILKVL